MASTELSVLFTSKGTLQNDLSGLRKELQGVQKDIKKATDAGDTGKVDALSRDYAQLEGKIAATRTELNRTNTAIRKTATDGVRQTSRLQSAWKKLQGVMRSPLFTAATIAGITLFGKRAVEAFAQAEQSQMKLVQAYQKFEGVGNVPIDAIRDLSSELQSLTGTDDDLLAASAATMAQFGLTGDAIMRVLPLLNDYAIYTGRDVTDAATVVGKAMMGNARALKEIGINFQSTGDQGKDFEAILAALESQVGDTGKAYGETAQGGLSRAQEAFGDLQEEIGGTLVPALTAMLRLVEPAAKWFTSLAGPIKGAAIAIGVLGAAALAIGPRIAMMVVGMKAAGVEAVTLKTKMMAASSFVAGPWGIALAAGTVALGYFIQQQADASARVDEFAGSIDNVTGKLNQAGVAKVSETLMGDISAEDWKVLEQFGFTVDNVTATVIGGGDAWDAFREKKAAAVGQASIGKEKELLAILETNVRGLREDVEDGTRAWEAAGKGMDIAAGIMDDTADATGGVSRQLVVLGRTLPLASYQASDYYQALSSAKSATDGLTQSLSDLSDAVNEWGSRDNFKKSLKTFLEEPTRDAARSMLTSMEQAANSIKDPGERADFTISAIGQIEKALNAKGMKLPPKVREEMQGLLSDAQLTKAAVDKVSEALDNMPDSKTVKIFLDTYGRVPAWATDAGAGPTDTTPPWTGGYIQGPGTGTSDSIRTKISNGEFILRAAAVRAIGVDKLNRINKTKAIDPALLERAEVQGHSGPLIGQVIVNNPSENVDVEAAVATALRRAERRRKERG